MENRTIQHTQLLALLRRIQELERRLIAPQRKGNQVHFQPATAVEEISFDYIQTALSAKSVLFPPVEELIRYHQDENGIQIDERNVDLIPETVAFGLRPCDAAAVTYLTRQFTGDRPDLLFSKRLEKTTFVTVSCTRADADCFCTSVGVTPGDTRGSDLLLTPLGGETYLAEVLTAKGEALVALAPELFAPAAAVNKEDYLAQVPREFDLEVLRGKLGKAFDSPFWEETSLRCIGCGACTYVCPVCSCFDIQDEGSHKKGTRLRCWDSCGSALFTLHASGHNPRHLQSERWRQRMMHKFSYMPEQLQVPGCVGCGRCLRACPADMNLIEQAQACIAAV